MRRHAAGVCQGGATAPGGGVGCSGAVLSECLERAWIRAAELQWTLQNASFIGRGTFLDTLTNPGLVLSLIWTQRGVGAG